MIMEMVFSMIRQAILEIIKTIILLLPVRQTKAEWHFQVMEILSD